MVPNKINYGDFKTPIEDINEAYYLQYLPGAKQPHNFHGKGESCYVLKSLTVRQSKICKSLLRLLPTFAGVFRGLQEKNFVRALVSVKASQTIHQNKA